MTRRGIVTIGAVVALAAIGVGATMVRARQGDPIAHASRSRAQPPSGQRIRVQVLNATKTRGLARRATKYLRDQGFDVVDIGTSPKTRDSTIVLDRSGHPEWARMVAKTLGARVESRPDSSRYLDVTVLLGATWRPPSEPFDP